MSISSAQMFARTFSLSTFYFVQLGLNLENLDLLIYQVEFHVVVFYGT